MSLLKRIKKKNIGAANDGKKKTKKNIKKRKKKKKKKIKNKIK